MTSVGRYEAGCNLFWVSAFYTPSPGIPINPASVDNLMDHHFAKPTSPHPLVLGVPDVAYDPMAHHGSLRSCSPYEVIHAYLFAIVRDMRAGCDATVLQSWLNGALSTTIKFELLDAGRLLLEVGTSA